LFELCCVGGVEEDAAEIKTSFETEFEEEIVAVVDIDDDADVNGDG
jgi:hypothetical protein